MRRTNRTRLKRHDAGLDKVNGVRQFAKGSGRKLGKKASK